MAGNPRALKEQSRQAVLSALAVCRGKDIPMSDERPLAAVTTPHQPPTREAHDAAHKPALKLDPSHHDAKLDIELDESFPSSDPPSNTQPRRGSNPAPSSGFKE